MDRARMVVSSAAAVRSAQTTAALLTRSQGSLDSSGRSSVVSYDSDDSGVSCSRSGGDDHILVIPNTPPRSTPRAPDKQHQRNKSITIEVRSPNDNGGVIELIEGEDGFIGYFKPADSPPRQMHTSPKRIPALPSNKSLPEYGCVNCRKIRPRITRSVSTNVSEDSCDSALQSKRYPNRRTSDDVASCSEQETAFSLKSHQSRKTKKFISNRKRKSSSASPLRTRTQKQIDHQVEQALSGRKIPAKTYGRRKSAEQLTMAASERKPLKNLKRKRESESASQKSQPSKKSKSSSHAGKSALRRIQHHNKSPERSPENGVQLPASASRHCRTRSHVKSLLKEVVTPSSPHSSPSTQLNTGSRPTARESKRPSPAALRLRTSVPTSTLKSSSGSARKANSGLSPSLQEQNEDSGLGSDDQTSSTAASACKWR